MLVFVLINCAFAIIKNHAILLFESKFEKINAKYCAFSGLSADNCTVIYNGDKRMVTSNGKVLNFYDSFM